MAHRLCSLSLLIILALASTLDSIHALKYVGINKAGSTNGGIRFNNDITFEYSFRTLITSTNFIRRLFQQNTDADRKNVPKITLIIEDMDGVAFATNGEIHVSARYIGGYTGDLKREISGVLFHENTHIWQWNGKGQTPGWLIEGIADFVRLKSGYVPGHWVKPGQGSKWDKGYDVTARFLDYCNDLRNGFVAELNKKMRNCYSENFFVELLGKNIEQLWSDYKAKYGNIN